MKCNAISNIIIFSATLRPMLCFCSSIFWYYCEYFFLEQLYAIFFEKGKTVAVQKRNISKDVRDCLQEELFDAASTDYN